MEGKRDHDKISPELWLVSTVDFYLGMYFYPYR